MPKASIIPSLWPSQKTSVSIIQAAARRDVDGIYDGDAVRALHEWPHLKIEKWAPEFVAGLDMG